MSINKQQALALADGFVNTVGGGKDGFKPRETISELELLAGEFIDDANNNLNATNSNASGELSKSLQALPPVASPGKLRVDIEMLFYGQFVNAGVKGLQSGSSTAGYAFKTPYPSEGMVAAIQDWVDRGKISTRTVKASKAYGRHETKQQSIADTAAWPIAFIIKQKGLKPTGFLDKAEKTTTDKVEQRLGSAFEIDIIKSITT